MRAQSSRSLTVGVDVSTRGLTSLTVTLVDAPPTLNDTRTAASRPASRTIRPSHLSMPAAVTVSVYRPIGEAGKTKMPEPLVVVFWVLDVAVSVNTTSAFGTTAADGST